VDGRLITPAPGAWLRLVEEFLAPGEADALFAALRDGIAWRQDSITIAGRSIPQPRLTAWFGDPDASYTYSGLRLAPAPWIEPLAALRRRVEQAASASFNSVLCNLYRDGRDSVGWHADDEPELGAEPLIASVSLGATRRFVMRPTRRAVDASPVELPLRHGALLVMGGATQRLYRHGVPKQPSVADPRINLTFRRVSLASAQS
jgi:alkylated DNA repair dioxygenase AlkB